MSWRNLLKSTNVHTRNIRNLRNIDSNISDISYISTFTETKKPSLSQILDLSKEIEAFEERAGIIEFDGETTREEAEQLAYAQLMHKLENNACFSWLSFNKNWKRNYH